MKIALIQCPLWGTFDPPIGLAQLSAYLKKERHQVTVFDLNIKLYLNQRENYKNIWTWEQTDFWYQPEYVKRFFSQNSKLIDYYAEEILKEYITIAGFSVNTASRVSSLEFARRLKARDKGITIVFGGPVFLKESFINDILNEGCVDIVIPGEGLLAFSNLIESFKLGKKINSCKGLVFKRGDAIINTSSAPLGDLNKLPFLDLDDLPLNDYDNGTHISLMTSRGCVRRCVFCSDGPCWPGYRVMSGRRIFEEVKFHKDKYKGKLGHVDFMDLVFNGNMDSLIEFCDLMIESDLDLSWTANMYIRPEMTHELIKKMKAAKCNHIIIGIESGSERVLRLMNKYYRMGDADRIIRQMYDEGICVTANFMFGFPCEREEDFEMTLDFLRRNGKYMGVYPSRTYCALEEFSYLEKHLEDFGIKPNPPNHLFWETLDGKNTYPVRLDRCCRFCDLALELGVEITAGVQTTVDIDKWFNLGCYYEFIKDYPKAIANFLNYFREDSTNELVKDKLLAFHKMLPEFELDNHIKDDLETEVDAIITGKILSKKIRKDRPLSSAFVRLQMDRLEDEIERFEKEKSTYSDGIVLINKIGNNISIYKMLPEEQRHSLYNQFSQLMQRASVLPLRQLNQRSNEAEFKAKRVWLDTFPVDVCLLFSDCKGDFRYIFEPECETGNRFNLEGFKKYKGPHIDFILSCAKRCILKGATNYSLDDKGGEILGYFEQLYPGLEIELFCKGINFSRKVIDRLNSYSSSYIVNFALNASNRDLHNRISNKGNFSEIMKNLEFLSDIKTKSKNIVLNITYTATALNIEDLPNIIRVAGKIGVDKVIVDYNRIYTPRQKNISCFFRQDLTNKIFDKVQILARDFKLDVQLPPKFKQDLYPEPIICREPWIQLVLNSEGRISPCGHFLIWGTKFNDMASVNQIWNSVEYRSIRGSFGKLGCSECSMFCYYVNPRQVNSLHSHIFNAKYFGSKNNKAFQKDFSMDLNDNEMEKVIDLAESFLSYQDFGSSERIIKYILEKVKYPSRPLRILAWIYREKAGLVNSTFEKEHILELAKEAVEKSLDSWAFDPYTYVEAARVYSLLGYHKEAKESIKRALSLAPQEENFKLLEEELDKDWIMNKEI